MMRTKPNTAFKVTRAAASSLDLAGKRVLIAGGTDGLGRAIARLAAERGAVVSVVGRTFRDAGVPRISFVQADLSLVREAERVASGVPEAEKLDAVVFTTGIIPGSTRSLSAEGIEMDMAVSTLSRHVILRQLLPRLGPSARSFVMGFPGTGAAGAPTDLNSDVAYAGGLGATHMKTVAANEALVTYWGAQGAKVYGLNPGLIPTSIRNSMHGGGVVGRALEGLLGLFSIQPDKYAQNVLPLLVAPELDAHPGASFGQDGEPILPSPAFGGGDKAYAEQWVAELDGLVAKAKGGAAGGAGGLR